jgi:hypothetical protein
MPTASALRKTTVTRRTPAASGQKFIEYTFEGASYTLDLDRNRVYRNWMAVETTKGFAILGSYRTANALSA